MMVSWLVLGCARGTLDGTCEVTPDNVLRATCQFEVDPPGALDLVLEADGEDPVLRSSADGPHHDLTVLRLVEQTRYRWTATSDGRELEGELTTGPVPQVADLDVQQQGGEAAEDTMFLVDCGSAGDDHPTAVALDRRGRVVWYQELAADLPPGPHPIVGLTFSEDHTVLAVLDRARVREFALDGELLADLEGGDGVDRVVHHDVFRRHGRTWVLTARIEDVDGEDYVIDGIRAFEDDGSVLFDWDLSMIATPSGPGGIGGLYWADQFPGAADWTHANGLYVDDDEDWVLSLHTLSTVLRIVGDPADPDFGTPEWVLDGSGLAPWPSTFAVDDPGGVTDDRTFGGQHHPTLLPDGSLQFFDNGDEVTDEARALRLRLDVGAGAADIVGSWPIGQVCPIEGAVFGLANGHVLVTCALRSSFYEVDTDSGAIVGTTTATCPSASGLELLPRAIPVERAVWE